MPELEKWLVPVFIIAYGDSEEEAVAYVEHALDTTWFVREDGIYSAEVLSDEVEAMEEDC